jgi:hypothetical protein
MEQEYRDERQHARIEVRLRARFTVLDRNEAEILEERILEAPSVWSPEGENELTKMADSGQSGPEGLLARAILDLSHQIGRLSHHLLTAIGPAEMGTISQISGGGAQFSTQYLLEEGSLLDIRLVDDELEAPPVRAIAEVVHVRGAPPSRYGIAFKTIHPVDNERLIRYIYQVQRRQLRQASLERF